MSHSWQVTFSRVCCQAGSLGEQLRVLGGLDSFDGRLNCLGKQWCNGYGCGGHSFSRWNVAEPRVTKRHCPELKETKEGGKGLSPRVPPPGFRCEGDLLISLGQIQGGNVLCLT